MTRGLCRLPILTQHMLSVCRGVCDLSYLSVKRHHLAKGHPPVLPAVRDMWLPLLCGLHQDRFPGRHREACCNPCQDRLKPHHTTHVCLLSPFLLFSSVWSCLLFSVCKSDVIPSVFCTCFISKECTQKNPFGSIFCSVNSSLCCRYYSW